jgi:cytidylate kinase
MTAARSTPQAPARPAPLVVAIDGPAASGKSTLARSLAASLGWAHLDSGAMYRAVTVAALERKVDPSDAAGIASLAKTASVRLLPDGRIWVNGAEVTDRIRTTAVDAAVSGVAEIRAVRDVMLEHQRRFAAENGMIVADGRDMGTRVFPDAVLKVFLKASEEERVRRRVEEKRTKDPAVDAAQVGKGMAGRDQRDADREADPLRPAADAVHLDTTGRTPDEVLAAVRALVLSRVPPSKSA